MELKVQGPGLCPAAFYIHVSSHILYVVSFKEEFCCLMMLTAGSLNCLLFCVWDWTTRSLLCRLRTGPKHSHLCETERNDPGLFDQTQGITGVMKLHHRTIGSTFMVKESVLSHTVLTAVPRSMTHTARGQQRMPEYAHQPHSAPHPTLSLAVPREPGIMADSGDAQRTAT